MESLMEILTTWGYPGLLIATMLSGSVIPFSSEVILLGLIQAGLDAPLCLLFATIGNTLGGLSCYWIGHMGRTDWVERYLHVKHEKVLNMQRFLQGKGALMAFFAFLPVVGEVIAIALGYMRSHFWLTLIAMTIGKLLRYWILIWILF